MLQWVRIADLVVDDRYQRPIYGAGRGNVLKIAADFRWSKFAPIVVAPVEGGRFAIIDGQHRTTAAALIGAEQVPAQVVIASATEQAEAFRSINGQVTRMHTLALQHAGLVSGDRRALEIQAVADAAEVTILRYPVAATSIKAGQTLALGAIRAALQVYPRETVITALQCVTQTSNNEPGALAAPIIKALVAVLGANIAWRDAGERLLEAFDHIDLMLELDEARVTRRPKGVATHDVLADRLRAQLSEIFKEGQGDERRAAR